MLGGGNAPFERLAGVVESVSRWFADHPGVMVLDINSVVLGVDGSIVAVDFRVETSALVVEELP